MISLGRVWDARSPVVRPFFEQFSTYFLDTRDRRDKTPYCLCMVLAWGWQGVGEQAGQHQLGSPHDPIPLILAWPIFSISLSLALGKRPDRSLCAVMRLNIHINGNFPLNPVR